jgi:BMFP domain-containing protein YqiC
MANQTPSELFTTLKGYLNELSDGERTPGEVASALGEWARDGKESIKVRVSEEVEASVAKMGFIQRAEFDALLARVAALEAQLLAAEQAATKSAPKKFSIRKSSKEKSETSVEKKAKK